jgi:hypothetical protein
MEQDGITELTEFLRKNFDRKIKNHEGSAELGRG